MSLYVKYMTDDTELTFSGPALSDVNLVTEADPSLCSLTADTLSFTVTVDDGTTLDLQEGQKVEIYKDDVLEHTQFVKDFERLGKNRYRLICQSLIGVMEEPFYGKIYTPAGPPSGVSEELVGDRLGNTWRYGRLVIDKIAKEAGCTAVYDSTNNLQNTTVAGYLPICTQREALQQVAFAAGLLVSTKDGNLNLRELSETVTSEFREQDIFYGGRVKQYPTVSKVEVSSVREKTVAQAWEEEADADEMAVYEIGRFVQMVDEPIIYNDGSATEVFEGDYGAGWFTANFSYAAFSGDSYIEFQKKTHARSLSETEKESSLKADGCTLLFEGNYTHEWQVYGETAPKKIYTENVTPVLDRLEAYAQLRVLVEQEVIVTNQRAGDYVRTITPWGSYVEGYIISMDARLTINGHRAKVKILGKFVDYTPENSSALGEFIIGESTLGGA